MRKLSGFKLVTALLLSGLLMVSGAGTALADTGDQAATNGQQQITIQQAITMAMASSNSLHSASAEVDQANNSLTTSQQGNPLDFTPSGFSSSDVEKAMNSLTEANQTLALDQIEYQVSQESVVYSVYQDYLNILQDETAQDAAQQALSLANLQQRAAVLDNQLGGYSQYQVQQANQISAQDQTTLSTDKATLATDYQKFDQLVGLAPDDTPALTDQPSYVPLTIDMDTEVNQVLAESPTILSDQETITTDKDATNAPTYTTSMISSADTLNVAENNLATDETNEAQTERDTYYEITNAESQQASLQQALNTAQQNLQAIQVGYSVGYNDSLDLAAAQSAVTAAQQSLLDNECQHQLNVMFFETPWVS